MAQIRHNVLHIVLTATKNIFEKKQWTLDRINNNEGHNHDNVVISCLDCNIKRGDMDSERFKKGKEIRIVRKQY